MGDIAAPGSDYRAWKSWSADAFGKVDQVEGRYLQAELRAAGADLGAVLTVLEIGFGNGAFAAWARARGWRYSGTELDPELVARALAAGMDAHHAGDPIASIAPGSSFDLVVAFDVLEHLGLDEIGALLDAVRARLAPGGRFIARFPSGDSPFAGAIQHGDLTHRSVIGSGMVEQLALGGGLRVLQVRAPAFPVTGMGIRRLLRRLPIVVGRALVGRVLRLLYFDNQPRVIEPNMLVVLAPVEGGRGA